MKFKTFFLISAAIAFLTLDTNAQEFKYGIQAGVGISNIRHASNSELNLDFPKSDYALSYNINGYLGFKSKTFLGISIEPGFIQKGAGFSDPMFTLSQSEIQLRYFNIPLLLDFHINESIVISVGPEFCFLSNAVSKSEGKSNSITEFYNDFELSGLIGIQLQVNEHMETGLRYSGGIQPAYKLSFTDDVGQPFGELKLYNHYFSVLFRYTI